MSDDPDLDKFHRWISRHLVSLVVLYRHGKQGELRTTACSGFVMSFLDKWYYVTAGHVLLELNKLYEHPEVIVERAHFVDFFGADADHRVPLPLDYANTVRFARDEGGLDFGLIDLSENHKQLLLANGIVALEEKNWMPFDIDQCRGFLMLGIPAEYVKARDGNASVSTTLISIRRLSSPPPGAEDVEYERFIGELGDMGSQQSIVGMSGGPIFGFRESADGHRYSIVALQSSWLHGRYVFGCPVKLFGNMMWESIGRMFEETVDKTDMKADANAATKPCIDPATQIHEWWGKLYKATRDAIIHATVPVFGYQNETVVQAGTGVLFRIADQHFVLTAAHVLDIALEHEIPLTIGNGAENGHPVKIERLTGGRSPLPPGEDSKDPDVRLNDPFDVGYIELGDNEMRQMSPDCRFATLQDVDPGKVKQGCYLVLGYPNVYSDPDKVKQAIAVHTVHYLTDLAKPFQDDRGRINLKYQIDSADGKGGSREAPKPQGISGSGVWRLSTLKKPEDWTADEMRLAGIERSWDKGTKLLKACPINYVLQMIYRGKPELRKIMDLHLGSQTIDW